MSGIATAVVGGAVVSGVVSNNASKRASETAKQTSEDQMEYTDAKATEAKAAINKLFPEATKARNDGLQNAANLFAGGLPLTAGVLSEGNLNAQKTIAGSMPQIQNAILGQPVDYSFAKPRDVSADYSQLLGNIPSFNAKNETLTSTAPAKRNVAMPKPDVYNTDWLGQLSAMQRIR